MNSCNSRLLLPSNIASPQPFAYPLAGHDAREHRDEDAGYTGALVSSQAENTLRVEARGCGKSCGNFLRDEALDEARLKLLGISNKSAERLRARAKTK